MAVMVTVPGKGSKERILTEAPTGLPEPLLSAEGWEGVSGVSVSGVRISGVAVISSDVGVMIYLG